MHAGLYTYSTRSTRPLASRTQLQMDSVLDRDFIFSWRVEGVADMDRSAPGCCPLLTSRTFYFGGQGFRLEMAVGGVDAAARGHVSLMLRYCGAVVGLKAKLVFKVLNRQQRPAYVEPQECTFGPVDFEENRVVCASPLFLPHDYLPRFIDNKGLTVQLEVLDLVEPILDEGVKEGEEEGELEDSEKVKVTGLW